MKPQPLEFASPQINRRFPWWTLLVVGFAGLSFAFGMAFDWSCWHNWRPSNYEEALTGSPFPLLVTLQEILAGYSFFVIGLGAFTRTRRPYTATAATWFLAAVAALAYGALPAVLGIASETWNPSSMQTGIIVALIIAALTPMFLPFILLRNTAEWRFKIADASD